MSTLIEDSKRIAERYQLGRTKPHIRLHCEYSPIYRRIVWWASVLKPWRRYTVSPCATSRTALYTAIREGNL